MKKKALLCKATILLTSLIISLAGCSSKPTANTFRSDDSNVKAEDSDLTIAEAQVRKNILSEIIYDLQIDLSHPEAEFFNGVLSMSFNLNDISKDLRLDFFEGQISSLEVNSQKIDLSYKKKYWIVLPAMALKTGANTLKISYLQKYSQSGQGLHRFKDPEDQQYYMYSQFETFDANRFMPCFDQPDLRSKFLLKVTAPSKWQVISTTQEVSKKIISEHKSIWNFSITPEIPTYIFSLHAGPYTVFKDTYTRADKSKIALRLFVRPALAKYVEKNVWINITKQGLKYFENFFKAKYPFGHKYDQIISPEYNWGGMENAAAVTYTESVVGRASSTYPDRRELASLLLHEIAHMWFGDLVTMKWWSDLWLNESFATYMSVKAMAEGTEFKEEWQRFTADTKSTAYAQDNLMTTHPIEGQVKSVKEAFATFDGITYDKGASVMKQLSYFITDAAFQKGLQNYFTKYAFKNTELKDFINELQAQTTQNLELWSKRWLQQSGVDGLKATWQCQGANLNEIKVELKTKSGRQFRPQSVNVIGLKLNDKKITVVLNKRVDLVQDGPLVLKGAWTCPDFIYPNNDDYGYADVEMSTTDISFLQNNLKSIADPLLRTVLWNDLWKMVRAGSLPLKNYIDSVRNNLHFEHDQIILSQVFTTFRSVLKYWPQENPQQKQDKLTFISFLEQQCLDQFKKQKTGSDDEKIWFDRFLSLAQTNQALSSLVHFYKSGEVSKKFKLDDDRRWEIVQTLVRYEDSRGLGFLSEMQNKDKSDRGLKQSMASQAIQPNFEVKKKFVDLILNPNNKSPSQEVEIIMSSLFPEEQDDLRFKFKDTFYDFLDTHRTSEQEWQDSPVIFGLLPLNCSHQNNQDIANHIERYEKINPTFSKGIKQALEEDARCENIRKNSLL